MTTRSATLARKDPPVPRHKLVPAEKPPQNIRLVYELGMVAGEDKETIVESIREFNKHPAIQLKCEELEKAGRKYLRLASSHGTGLAAKSNIPRDTELCYYVGIVYDAKHNPSGNHSIEMGLSGTTLIYINASQIPHDIPLGRCMHMGNHSCAPNCTVTYYVPDGWNYDLVLFVLVAAQDIVTDEEVTFQYKGTMWQPFSTLPLTAPDGFRVIKCGCKNPCPNKLGRLDWTDTNYRTLIQERDKWGGGCKLLSGSDDSPEALPSSAPAQSTLESAIGKPSSSSPGAVLKSAIQRRASTSLERRQATTHGILNQIAESHTKERRRKALRDTLNDSHPSALKLCKATRALRTSSPRLKQQTLNFSAVHTSTRHLHDETRSAEHQADSEAVLNTGPTFTLLREIPHINISTDVPLSLIHI